MSTILSSVAQIILFQSVNFVHNLLKFPVLYLVIYACYHIVMYNCVVRGLNVLIYFSFYYKISFRLIIY